MPISTAIIDGRGTSNRARVTPYGQVVTGPVAYNRISTQTLDVNNQVYNFVAPLLGHNIVIDGILLYANKGVGTNDASVVLYESAEGPASAVHTTVILETEMVKKTSRDLIGLNYLCSQGVWINATTDDDDVFVTLLYYYVPDTEFT